MSMQLTLLRRNGAHTTTSTSSLTMDIVLLTVSMLSFQVNAVRAAPSPIVRRDTDDSNNNKSLSPQIWIPAVVVVLFLLMIFTLLWTRKSMINRIRQLSLSQNQNSIRDTSSTSVTASQLLGNRNNAANGNANTTGGARTRRTPSQISTISLPVYNKEPGEHELVIIRGPEDMEDAMPTPDLGVSSPTSASRLTLSNVNVTNRQINPIRPRMPIASDENDSLRSSTESVNLVPPSALPISISSAPANINDNSNLQPNGDGDNSNNNIDSTTRNMNLSVSPIYNPLPQTNFQMPLLGLAEQSRGESMLNIDESGEVDVEEEPDASTLELMPKNLGGGSSSGGESVSGSGSGAVVGDNVENESGRRRSVNGSRNSIRNSIRNSLRGSIRDRDRDSRRDSRGPAPPYFEVVDLENESVQGGEGGRGGPPGLSVRTNGISQSSSTSTNGSTNGSRLPTPTSTTGTSLRPISPLSIASSSLHTSSNGTHHDHDQDNGESQEGILMANTNANARRRTGGGIRSFFNTLSTRPPTNLNLTGLAHVRHRASQSGGSGSTFSTANSSTLNTNFLSRTRSNNTLASNGNGSRLDVSSNGANASNTRLTSASTLSVNSISAPLTHTVMRTEIRYPRGGPTPEQIRFISSKENLGGRFVLGVPYGEDAVAHQSSLSLGLNSFASLGGAAVGMDDEPPPPEFEEEVGGGGVSGLPVASSSNSNVNAVATIHEGSRFASSTGSGNATPTRSQTPTGATTSNARSPTLHIVEPSASSSQTVTNVDSISVVL